MCCLQETLITSQDTKRLKVKVLNKVFHAKETKKRAGVAILLSEKKHI